MSKFNFTRSWVGAIFAALLLTGSICAQVANDPVTIPVQFQGMFEAPSGEDPYVSISSGGSAVALAEPGSGGTGLLTSNAVAHLRPGRVYEFSVTAEATTKLSVKFSAPDGYRVFINGVEHEMFFWEKTGGQYLGAGAFNVRIDDGKGGAVGEAASLRPGRVLWTVGMGSLRNGKTAGNLMIAEQSASTSDPLPANTYRPLGLYYSRDTFAGNGAATSDDGVYVLKVNGALRQVHATTVLADVEVVNDYTYTIKMYGRSQVSALPNGSGLYTVSGTPIYEFRIENPTYPNRDALRITRTTNQGTPVTQWTELRRQSGTQWLVHDWVDKPSGATTVESPVRYRWTYSDSDRNETMEIVNSSNAVSYKSFKRYEDINFGSATSRELSYETVGDSITTTYTYHTSQSNLGAWRKIKTITLNDGSWTGFDYHGDFRTRGRIHQVRRPHKDAPASDPGLNATTGEVTTYTYTFEDGFGTKKLPTKIETKTDDVVTARSEMAYAYEMIQDSSSAYSDPANAQMPVTVQTRKDYYGSGGSDFLTTVSRVYREDADPEYRFFRGLVHSVLNPDGTAVAMAYLRSVFVGTTAPFVPNQYGESRVHIAVHGTTDTSLGMSYPTEGATQPLPAGFRVVDGKSTKTMTLLNGAGLTGITQVQARVSNGWQTTRQEYTYYTSSLWLDHVERRTAVSGAFWNTVANTWSGGRLAQSIDESGITQTYTYDSQGLGRAATITRAAATSGTLTVPSQTISRGYDTAGRLTSESTSNGSETLASSQSFDTAGRLTSQSRPGMSPTSFTYNVAARTTTVSLPSGEDLVETRYRDGRVASMTGPAVVPEYYSYAIETNGQRKATVFFATNPNARKQETWRDWLGRTVQTKKPGFTGQADFTITAAYHSTRGILEKRSRTGYWNEHFIHSGMGEMTRMGMGAGSNGLVEASADRITDSDISVESYDSALWVTTRTYTFPTLNSGTSKLMGIVRERLTGLSSTLKAETRSWDAENNLSTRTVTVNPSSKQATVISTAPGMSGSSVQVHLNGLPVSATGFDGLTVTQGYDSLGRPTTSVDPRTGTSTATYHPGTDLIKEVVDGAGKRLSFISYDASGRPAVSYDAFNKTVRTAYNARGQVEYRWGSASYPVAHIYNSFGQIQKLRTYRDTSSSINWDAATWPGGAATYSETEWEYDAPSGLLKKEYDHSREFVEFTYNERGQTYQRFWARTHNGQRVSATYAYKNGTGELDSISYNDGTPSVSYGSYTRLGQPTSVTDASGARTFNYDPASPWRTTGEVLPGYFGSRVLSRLYDTSTSTNIGDSTFNGHTIGSVAGRYRGYRLGTTATPAADLEFTYAASSADRIAGLVAKRSNGAVSRKFVYGYQANSALVKLLSVVGSPFSVDRTFEPNRDLLASIETKWNATVRTHFAYTYNDLRQRDTVVQSGDVFEDYGDAIHQIFEYTDRGELKTAAAYLGAAPTSQTSPLSARRHEYGYDAAGNRTWSNASGIADMQDDYVANDLNQYTSRENNALAIGGTAAPNAKVAVNPDAPALAGRAGRHWGHNVVVDNVAGPFRGPVTVYSGIIGGGSGGKDLLRVESKTLFLPPAGQVFTYDGDGNMTGDDVWSYAYDAENRLVRMTPTSEAVAGGLPNHRLEFRYDYRHRRIGKKVIDASNDTVLSERRFIYDGWDVVAELDGSGALKRSFTWGLDVTGSLTAAGGVGALLQIHDHDQNKTLFVSYDGNGNVAALINATSGATEASYEYSPFGELIRAAGPYAQANPFRFSTKWQDEESGLVYYGFRYYNARNGRFINRDPSGVAGGLNLYGFSGNDGVNGVDLLGLLELTINGKRYDVVPVHGLHWDKVEDNLPADAMWTGNLGRWGISVSAYWSSIGGPGLSVNPDQYRYVALSTDTSAYLPGTRNIYGGIVHDVNFVGPRVLGPRDTLSNAPNTLLPGATDLGLRPDSPGSGGPNTGGGPGPSTPGPVHSGIPGAIASDSKNWSSNGLPEWADFRGTPDIDSIWDAEIVSGLDIPELQFDVAFNENEATVWVKNPEIKPVMKKSQSWVKPGKQTARLLQHERGHYIITREAARSLTDVLRSLRVAAEGANRRQAYSLATRSLQMRLKDIIDDVVLDHARRQEEYDTKTRHGTNESEQDKWNMELGNQ